MNNYKTSLGQSITQAVIQRNISKAKEIMVRTFKNDNGYIFCQFTGQSSGRIDIMHLISVDECKKSGRVELVWAQRNLRFGTREVHDNHDKKTHAEREQIFNDLNK